jgi:hypothetical protein
MVITVIRYFISVKAQRLAALITKALFIYRTTQELTQCADPVNYSRIFKPVKICNIGTCAGDVIRWLEIRKARLYKKEKLKLNSVA